MWGEAVTNLERARHWLDDESLEWDELVAPSLAALLDTVAAEARKLALEEVANLVQARKHGVGIYSDDAENFTRDWNDGRVLAYQDAEDRIRDLAAKVEP